MISDDRAPTFAVTAGGQPSDVELAAIGVALHELSHEVAEVAATRGAPAWTRAALLEGVGGDLAPAPHALHTGRAPGRAWRPAHTATTDTDQAVRRRVS